MNISILILAAGPSGLETHDGDYPLCLTEFDGLSLIERIVLNTRNLESAQYAFAFRNDEAKRFHLEKIAKLLASSAAVYCVPENTQGSACTALISASQLDPDSELLVISANELVDIDYGEVVTDFRSRSLDAGTLVFRSVHPRYSYVRVNKDGFVTEAAQQDPISHNATVGVFWFYKTRDFVAATMDLIRKNANVNGKFYIAPTFNELILNQARVGVRKMEVENYKPLKTERQIQQFENGYK